MTMTCAVDRQSSHPMTDGHGLLLERWAIGLRYPRSSQHVLNNTGHRLKEVRTNDRLYESKDSREILNGSSELNTLRWLDELVEEPLDRLDQKVL